MDEVDQNVIVALDTLRVERDVEEVMESESFLSIEEEDEGELFTSSCEEESIDEKEEDKKVEYEFGIVEKKFHNEILAFPSKYIDGVYVTMRHSQGRNTIENDVNSDSLIFQCAKDIYRINTSTMKKEHIDSNEKEAISCFVKTEKYLGFGDKNDGEIYVRNLETNDLYKTEVFKGYRFNTMVINGNNLYAVGQTNFLCQYFINTNDKCLELVKTNSLGSYGNSVATSHNRKYLVTTMDRGGAHFFSRVENTDLYEYQCQLPICYASDFVSFNSNDTMFAVASESVVSVFCVKDIFESQEKVSKKTKRFRTLRGVYSRSKLGVRHDGFDNIYYGTSSICKFHPTNPNLLVFNSYRSSWRIEEGDSTVYIYDVEKNVHLVEFKVDFETKGLCFSRIGDKLFLPDTSRKKLLQIELSSRIYRQPKLKKNLFEKRNFGVFVDVCILTFDSN